MIDIENEIFTTIATAVRSGFPGISVYGESHLVPESFPCLTIQEIDNYTDIDSIDSGSFENVASVTYELNVYTNDTSGKKAKAKAILGVADGILINKGFSRTSSEPISLDDSTKCRIVARYRAKVGRDKMIYRR